MILFWAALIVRPLQQTIQGGNMKKIAILMAAVMVMLFAAGCVTTTPEKNYQAVVKPKSCK